jgi:hypothetical protein
MKTKTVIKLSLLAGVMALASCQQNGILHEINPYAAKRNAYIEFGNYVNKMTRAAKNSGKSVFAVGDTMAVWGIQNTDGVVDVIFNNQDVRYIADSTWTYDNKKLWNIGSTYMFYGVFPYSKTLYTMSDDGNWYITIPQYTTPDDAASQTDLMISERRDVSPFNTVDMYFHHILSNVNVYAKIGNTMGLDDIETITLKSAKLNNIKNTGKYAQTGWNQDRPVGAWTDLSGVMNIPAVTDKELSKSPLAIYQNYLMMPQVLFSTDASPVDVTIDAVFHISYKDGTTSTFIKNGIRLAGITGTNGTSSSVVSKWEPNYKYNYTLSFNPNKSTRIWDADGDGGLIIDPITGDTISKDDDTPTKGNMKYNPDDPDHIKILEDTDGDGVPDTWVTYPVVWEDVDDDGLLEAGIDRDNDGHIDDVDGDNQTQQVPGGDPNTDPSDGNPNNPSGKDVILVHVDTDGDGDIDDDDDWVQVQKDKDTGVIVPAREQDDAYIEFTATVQEWEQIYTVDYDVLH